MHASATSGSAQSAAIVVAFVLQPRASSASAATMQTQHDNDSRERLLQADEGLPLRPVASRTDDDVEQYADADDELESFPLRDEYTGKPSSKFLGNFFRRRRCLLITSLTLALFALIVGAGGFWVWNVEPAHGQSPPWYPTPKGGTVQSWADSYKKAADMVSRMQLVEKVNITTGIGWSMGLAVGNTGPAVHVGFPSLSLQDGPLGIRHADHITAFPAGITVGATWNKELMYMRGKAHGNEARLKGIHVLLGPCVGALGKHPAGGRNWEGFGADGYLQGIAARETIRGIQGEGVMATIKHFIGNEQEHFRQSFEWGIPNAMSSNIDDRTLHEIYLWPFADAVHAGVASVMCSYQMVNNSYACGNSKLLNGILKDELGFQGFVQSDWLAQRSGVASALAGLDMSMPGDGLRWQNGDSLWGPKLTEAVLNGSVPISRLNDMATRIVASWYKLGQNHYADDFGPNFSSWTNDRLGYLHPGSPDDKELVEVNKFVDVQGSGNGAHGWIVRQIAGEGIVMVKNDDKVLPLNHNGWSDPTGDKRKYNVGIFGEDATDNPEGPNSCPDRACNKGTLASGWGSGAVEFPYLVSPETALRTAFNPDYVSLSVHATNDVPASSDMKDLDLCLVFINADAGEGFVASEGVRGDRNDLYAQKGGDKLAQAVGSGCGGGHGRTVVIMHSVGPVIVTNWVDLPTVKSILMAHLPGQESGGSLVDVLFGDTSPSGKLPYTIGRRESDYGPGSKILSSPNAPVPQQNFSEGLYVDYRYFDKHDIEPQYEFGFGLSYTTFSFTNISLVELKGKSAFPDPRPSMLNPPTYDETLPPPSSAVFPSGFRQLSKYIYPYIKSESDIKQGRYPYPHGYNVKQPLSPAGGGEGGNPSLWEDHLRVEVTLTNTGSVAGSEVVQLYLSYPSQVPKDPHRVGPWAQSELMDMPVKVLRGFEKVQLEPREKRTVSLLLTRKDLSYWNVVQQNWVMPTSGQFTLHVGRSSRDLPLNVQW